MKPLLAGTGVCAALLLAGCSSSTNSNTPTPTSQATSPPATSTAAPTTSQTAPPTVDLSGSWSGQYSGPFNGTFTLNWTQTSGDLNGQIVLSSPPDTLHINGTVSGSSISFGAVGVVAYSGSLTGTNSMSGSYTDVANGQTGSWSATKSS